MSKLTSIKNQLLANPNIVTVAMDEYPPLKYPTGESALHKPYRVDFFVAPVNSTYLPNPLNSLMKDLLIEEPNHQRDFSLWVDTEKPQGGYKYKYFFRLSLGYVIFSENIGLELIDTNSQTCIRLISRDLEFESIENMVEKVKLKEFLGPNVEISSLNRAIYVHCYPNIELAKEKYGQNDMGRQVLLYKLEESIGVGNAREIYMLWEKEYQHLTKARASPEERKSNLNDVLRLRVQ